MQRSLEIAENTPATSRHSQDSQVTLTRRVPVLIVPIRGPGSKSSRKHPMTRFILDDDDVEPRAIALGRPDFTAPRRTWLGSEPLVSVIRRHAEVPLGSPHRYDGGQASLRALAPSPSCLLQPGLMPSLGLSNQSPFDASWRSST